MRVLGRPFVWITLVLCAVPLVFMLISGQTQGHDPVEGVPSVAVNPAQAGPDALPWLAQTSSPTHSMLEIAAFLVAMLVVVMAFFHYGARGDFAAPVIGLALLSGGLMDFLHIMAAEGFLGNVADPVRFVPFSWMLARAVPALILILSSSAFMVTGPVKSARVLKRDVTWLGILVALCALVSGGVIYFAMTRAPLPECIYPGSLFKRPWEFVPVGLLLVAGIYCLPMFWRWHRSSYSLALCLSVLPLLVAEMHLVFGAGALFNQHVVAAHGLKLMAYVLVLVGFEMDHRKTYLEAKRAAEKLREGDMLLSEEESSLSQLEQLLDTVLEHVCEGVYLKDVSGRFLRVSDFYADICETEDAKRMLMKTEAEFRSDAAGVRNHEADIKAMEEGMVVRDTPVDLIRGDGRSVRLVRSRIPLWDKEGNVVGLVGICRKAGD